MRKLWLLWVCCVVALPLVAHGVAAHGRTSHAVYLAWVTTRPAVPQAGPWWGQGCRTPGGPCNIVGFVVSMDRATITEGCIQAGRDRMTCQNADAIDGAFVMECGGGLGIVRGRFDSPTQASGHYVVDWPGFSREEADWTGAALNP